MGEPVTTAILIGTTATQIGMQHVAAKKSKRAADMAENAQLGEDRQAREQSQREQRIRRARILQAGENTGSSDSSQEGGVLGGMGTIAAKAVGAQKGQQLSNIAIGDQLQSAANSELMADTFGAIGSMTMQYANYKASLPKPPA